MLVDQFANAFDLADQFVLYQQISSEITEQRAVFVVNAKVVLLLDSNSKFGQAVCQRILVDLLAMSAAEVLVNCITGFSNDIAERKNILFVRFGTHVRFLSVFICVSLCLFVANLS